MNLGLAYAKREKPQDAITSYQRAAAVYKELKYVSGQARALLELGKIYYSESRFDDAIRNFDQVRSFFESYPVSVPDGKGPILVQLAQSYESKKDMLKAIGVYEEAANFYHQSGSREKESNALFAISGIYERLGDQNNAAIYKQRAEKVTTSPTPPTPPQP
jgi:tetratricopeptide (TPR) repeat protein